MTKSVDPVSPLRRGLRFEPTFSHKSRRRERDQYGGLPDRTRARDRISV
jgi:hypothetical protein